MAPNVNGDIAQHADPAGPANSVRPTTDASNDRAMEDKAFDRIGVISINAGEAVLYELARVAGIKATKFVSLESRQRLLPPGTNVVFIRPGKWIPLSIGHRVILGPSTEQLREVFAAVAGLNVVFVVVALGHPNELENALMIVQALRTLQIMTFAAAIQPFAHSKYTPLQ